MLNLTLWLARNFISFPFSGRFHDNKSSATVGTLILATIYLQLIQNRYMFRSFTVLQCSHQHCVQPVASDVEVVGSIRTINTTGAAKGILRLPHRWQRVVHNAGDYNEGQ